MNKHESAIRAASLVARLRHANGDSDMLIEAAEAFATLEAENVRLKTRLADTDVALSGCKLERDELRSLCDGFDEAAHQHFGRLLRSTEFGYSQEMIDTPEPVALMMREIERRDARVKVELVEHYRDEWLEMNGSDLRAEAVRLRKQAEEMGDE